MLKYSIVVPSICRNLSPLSSVMHLCNYTHLCFLFYRSSSIVGFVDTPATHTSAMHWNRTLGCLRCHGGVIAYFLIYLIEKRSIVYVICTWLRRCYFASVDCVYTFWRESVHWWQHTVTTTCRVKHWGLFSVMFCTQFHTINYTKGTVISSPELTFPRLEKLWFWSPHPVFRLLNCMNSIPYQIYSWKLVSHILYIVSFLRRWSPFPV